MQMIYNSANYCIVEFPVESGQEALAFGGYEIVDKNYQREIFLGGNLAEQFRAKVRKLFEDEPSTADIDAFLGQFDKLMMRPIIIH